MPENDRPSAGYGDAASAQAAQSASAAPGDSATGGSAAPSAAVDGSQAADHQLKSAEQPLAETYDTAMLDLDGVVYVGEHAVDGVPHRLAALRAAGLKLAFVTNNAARTPEAVAEHLAGIGVDAAGQDVVTSAQAAARLLAARFAPGSAILVVGGEGLVAALAEHRLRAVSSAEEDPVAVVQGFHPDVGWRLLCEGAIALARGLPWIASNTDLTIPTARGLAPGNGTLVSALAVTTGRQPEVAGKPGTPLFDETVIRVGASHPIVVGDRLDTDIEGANACHADSLLVLTGVTDLAALLAADPPRRPTYVATDLSGLNSPHRTVTWSGDQATCGRWRAGIGEGGVVHLARDGADERGDDLTDAAENLDGLRAVVSAGWHHRDSLRARGGESVLDTAAAERRLGLARMSS